MIEGEEVLGEALLEDGEGFGGAGQGAGIARNRAHC